MAFFTWAAAKAKTSRLQLVSPRRFAGARRLPQPRASRFHLVPLRQRTYTHQWHRHAEGGTLVGGQPRLTTSVVTAQDRAFERSMDAYFRMVLPNVPQGPAWLHDIAMVGYDYLSDNGAGWERDVRRCRTL